MKQSIKNLIIPIATALILLGNPAHSQNSGKPAKSTEPGGEAGYTTGIGLRCGLEGGFSFKHFIKEGRALEGLLSRGWRYGGFRVTALYEMHYALPGVKGMDWFLGIGAHAGFFGGAYYGYYGYTGTGYYDSNGVWHSTGYRNYYLSLGVDVIAGVEYQFEDFPFTVGFDVKPQFDLFGRARRYGDVAFTFRYILN